MTRCDQSSNQQFGMKLYPVVVYHNTGVLSHNTMLLVDCGQRISEIGVLQSIQSFELQSAVRNQLFLLLNIYFNGKHNLSTSSLSSLMYVLCGPNNVEVRF